MSDRNGGVSGSFGKLNADLFGVDGVAADAEIIELSHACLTELWRKAGHVLGARQ